MNLPIAFIRDIETALGKEETARLAQVLSGEDKVTSFRLNSLKSAALSPEFNGRQVPWCESGYYVDSRPSFTFDPLFHAGSYYVQEASSMFVEQVLEQYVTEPVRFLDLCAAPGGKSTLALQILPEGSLLVSNEIDRLRSRILSENITKWGHTNCLVTNNAPRDFARFKHYFDVLLTDVPCSGEGMFRKDKQTLTEWSEKNVSFCVKRQREILEDCWECLKPGGLLIYSTCTFNVHEDEENVHWLAEHFGAKSLPVRVEAEWNITGNLLDGSENVYHFFPHKTEGEGFFLAVMRKPGEDDANSVEERQPARKMKRQKLSLTSAKIPRNIMEWLSKPEDFIFQEEAESIIAVPRFLKNDFDLLKAGLYCLNAGLVVAQKKGKDWMPAHALAMSAELRQSAFQTCELPLEMAWAYLRGESFALPESKDKGFVLVTYKGHPLGFVKNLGNRCNNLYPKNWKIKSGYLPDSQVVFSVVQ